MKTILLDQKHCDPTRSMLSTICLLVVGAVGVYSQCGDVCYDDVGCFTNCPPFDDFPLPKSPEDIGAEFRLFTRQNRDNYDVVTVDNVGGSNYNPGRSSTVFVIHGFSETTDKAWLVDMKNAFLDMADYNVVLVDWRRGARPDLSEPIVPYPGSNAQVVGALTRNLLDAMVTEGQDEGDVHCVGFSLGAHACGYLGKRSAALGRISGLDPAADIFENPDGRVRLNTGDADYIDNIHTNGYGHLSQSGISFDIGNVDFWPNSGGPQPGCSTGVCAHERSTELFIESLESSCEFTSEPCDSHEDMRNGNCQACGGESCQYMGYDSINHPGRGTFYLPTNSNPPFCQG